MKSDFVELAVFERIFPYMTSENRRAVSLSLQSGLRIGDVVALKRNELNKKTCILKYKASKTGKIGTVALSREMVEQLVNNSGKTYLFEGIKHNKHRTRQAVWADVKKASRQAGVTALNVTPHSARKNYAVNLLRQTGDIKEVQKALQHTNQELTEYYAHSDEKPREGVFLGELDLLKPVIRECLVEVLPEVLLSCLREIFCNTDV